MKDMKDDGNGENLFWNLVSMIFTLICANPHNLWLILFNCVGPHGIQGDI